MKRRIMLIIFTVTGSVLYAQQIADTTYHPMIHNPAYDVGKGPVIYIDEGHHNFHTKEGRYKAFSHLLESDLF